MKTAIQKIALYIKQPNFILNSRCGLSANNFNQLVNHNKEIARKHILIENLSAEPNVNINSNNIEANLLKESLDIDFESFHAWTFRKRNFYLLQLKSPDDVKSIKSKCGYNLHALPVDSRMLETTFKTPLVNGTKSSREDSFPIKKEIDCNFLKSKFSSQELIRHLNEVNSLNDLDVQLRYFLITQLEELLCRGSFSGFQIFPFGSSLAGLGDSTSDLDLVLLHSSLHYEKKLNFTMPDVKSERDLIQLSLSSFADILRHFTPNFSQVTRILRARVPIVKMSFDLAPIDIDISIELSKQTAHHGFIIANYMSYSVKKHAFVREFFIFIKHWARQNGLVKSIPGTWFTNFQLITLAIFFLQKKEILKSIETYEKDNTEKSANQRVSSIKLVYEFLEFIVSFDFEKDAISILRGQTFIKPDFSPLFIENPIERELNICKNVSGVEFKKLLLLAYNSLDAMHTENFHLADLLDPQYLKELEKQSSVLK